MLGKYLAAAAIFSVSLLFSQMSHFSVLTSLTIGELDSGLLFSTYVGYWLIGLSMLSVGMVASFLTSNLTIGFILGAMFNAPLVFAQYADAITGQPAWARTIASWSIAARFEDFGRGVISLSSVSYFLMVTVVGLYLSLMLIGRRHWSGGRDGHSMVGHYIVRAVSLIVITLSASLVFARHDQIRYDATLRKVSSLADDTKKLVRELKPKHTIVIDAFVSAQVPEAYVQTKHDLLSRLKEFQSLAGSRIQVRLHDNLEPFSDDAALAEERYGITARQVQTRSRGAIKDEDVILGAAITCGLEKVVVPFFEYGVPVEYELVRSICTVGRGKRRLIGILKTDANIMGGMTMAGNVPRQAILDELEKQYELEAVDPARPIPTGKYDVLLAVQPSTLNPSQMPNFIAAVQAGQPTAIFEDPFPVSMPSAVGTSQPKRPQGGMFGGGAPPEPKGDMQPLWNMLGMRIVGESDSTGQFQADVIWQRFNPYRKLQLRGIGPELVFVRPDAPGAADAFNATDPITSGLEEMLFFYPGGIEHDTTSDVDFAKLVSTGDMSGKISWRVFVRDPFGRGPDPREIERQRGAPIKDRTFTLAARIRGPKTDDAKESSTESAAKDDAAKDDAKPLNVVYVADIDCLNSNFVAMRATPDANNEIHFNFENVTMILNIIDDLSGDDEYIEIRKRKPFYSTLRMVEIRSEDFRKSEYEIMEEYQEEYDKAIKDGQQEIERSSADLRRTIEDLNKKMSEGDALSRSAAMTELNKAQQRLELRQADAQKRFEIRQKRLQRELEVKVNAIRRDMDLKILKIQNQYKVWAVVIPPIPPLMVALVVFVWRRLREREGVSKERLRV